jgi:hypothetical protein
MDRKSEKARELIEQARRLGLRVDFDSGLVVLEQTGSGDPELRRALVAELFTYLAAVRDLLAKRSLGAAAEKFVGQRIWSERGEGTLVSTNEDGVLTVLSASPEMRRSDDERRRSRGSISTTAESILILNEAPSANAVASSNDQASSQEPKPGIFKRLMGS